MDTSSLTINRETMMNDLLTSSKLVEGGKILSMAMPNGKKMDRVELLNFYILARDKNEELKSQLENKLTERKKLQAKLSVMQRTFNEMPTDCILEVFNYIDVRRILTVCKLWTNTILDKDNRFHFMCIKDRKFIIGDNINPDKYSRLSAKLNLTLSGENPWRTEQLKCLPENFFGKCWTILPNPLIIRELGTQNCHLVKTAFSTCPQEYLQNIRKLKIACKFNDDWSWMIATLSNLEHLQLSIQRYSDDVRKLSKNPPHEMSKLIDGIKGSLKTLILTGYNYNSDGSKLLESLINTSNMGNTGLEAVFIHSTRNPKRVQTKCFPLKLIIKFLEKAKFSKTSVVLLQFAYCGSASDIFDWANVNTTNLEKSQLIDDHNSNFKFEYRDSKFDIYLNLLPVQIPILDAMKNMSFENPICF